MIKVLRPVQVQIQVQASFFRIQQQSVVLV